MTSNVESRASNNNDYKYDDDDDVASKRNSSCCCLRLCAIVACRRNKVAGKRKQLSKDESTQCDAQLAAAASCISRQVQTHEPVVAQRKLDELWQKYDRCVREATKVEINKNEQIRQLERSARCLQSERDNLQALVDSLQQALDVQSKQRLTRVVFAHDSRADWHYSQLNLKPHIVMTKVRDEIIAFVLSSNQSLDICINSLTSVQIFSTIVRLVNEKAQIKVRILIHKSSSDNNNDKSNNNNKINSSGSSGCDKSVPHLLKLARENKKQVSIKNLGMSEPFSSIMNHKFAIKDKRRVLTGSTNWTKEALESNYESLLISSEQPLVDEHCDEFDILWRMAFSF